MFDLTNIRTKYIPSFDPFDVKRELVTLAEDYFQVGNLDVYESGFLGYLIQSLTFLTSDTLYQNAMAYNEAFLNRAILPSSVSEIASQLDYAIAKTVPASGFLTLIIPIPNNEDLLVKISAGSAVFADNIPYKVKHSYYVEKDGKIFNNEKFKKYLEIYRRNKKKNEQPPKKQNDRRFLEKFENDISYTFNNYRDFIKKIKNKKYDKMSVFILEYDVNMFDSNYNIIYNSIIRNAEKYNLKYEIIIKSAENKFIIKTSPK